MKIWQRHILGQLIRTFLFFLFCLFVIYVVVDLSVHGVRFLSSGKTPLAEIALYYLRTFAVLLELFLTLTFLLATMRVLFDLNEHRELVALQMAGLSKKRLLAPFFLFAAFLSAICYLNSQWFSPDAQDVADAFMVAHKPKKKKKTESIHVYSVSLEDDSELVYQSFDQTRNELYDVFWIRTPNDIWHMKHLELAPLRGHYVNHLTRNKKLLEKAESFVQKDFPELPWNQEAILQKFVPYENRPLLTLLFQGLTASAERRSVLSHLYYKLLVPLMPFLVLFAIGPISLHFSRHRPLFLITACALFGFIALKVILDGMLILGENQVLPALVAIFGPVALVLAFSLPKFARMR